RRRVQRSERAPELTEHAAVESTDREAAHAELAGDHAEPLAIEVVALDHVAPGLVERVDRGVEHGPGLAAGDRVLRGEIFARGELTFAFEGLRAEGGGAARERFARPRGHGVRPDMNLAPPQAPSRHVLHGPEEPASRVGSK